MYLTILLRLIAVGALSYCGISLVRDGKIAGAIGPLFFTLIIAFFTIHDYYMYAKNPKEGYGQSDVEDWGI